MRDNHHIPFSIITVCFNEAQRIELTCQSVVQQTFQEFEWIVIDGGSTDGTLDILKRYAQRMTYFVSEPDCGIYHAMNKGVAQAHGTYLLFLNGGDYLYESDTLAKVFAHEQPLNKDIYYGDLILERDGVSERYSIDFTDTYATFARRTFPHQATFIKRTLFEMYGMHDESFKISADLEFFLRVFVSNPKRKQHRIGYVPFIVSVYENARGLSSSNLALRKIENKRARMQHYPARYLRFFRWRKRFAVRKDAWMDAMRHFLNNANSRNTSCRK